MLEKYQNLLEKLKSQNNEKKVDTKVCMSLSFVQSLFEMQDVNKWLKFNATNENQTQHVERADAIMQTLLEKLYVPDYQLENV